MEADRLVAWSNEMRQVHEQLRTALDVAKEAVEAGASTEQLAQNLRLFCWGFCVSLDGHHNSEDGALFPLILEARPDLAPVIANLKQDHSMIAHLIGGVEKTLASTSDPDELMRHLDGIESVMETHFGYEERQLLAILDGIVPADASPRAMFGPLA